MSDKLRCTECGEFHKGKCEKYAQLAFRMDCLMDALDEYLDLPPEPGGRRWMIARGEYPPDAYPSNWDERLTPRARRRGESSH